MIPRDGVSPATTRVLLALVTDHQAHGRSTVASVARQAGRSVSGTHLRLTELRHLGLVDWTRGRGGTLRPTVHPQTLNPTSRPR